MNNINRLDSRLPKLPKAWQHNRAHIDFVDRRIEEYNATKRPVVERLEIISKVVDVVFAIFLVSIPLALSYLPAWASLGVGIPTFIILSLLTNKLKEKIEVRKRCGAALLLLRERLNRPSYNALQLVGKESLPAVDPRLKSDQMMQKEFKKKHPKGAARVTRMVATLNLDVTYFEMTLAGRDDAQILEDEAAWKGMKWEVKGAKRDLLLKGHLKAYVRKMSRIKYKAHCIRDSHPREPDQSHPSATAKDLVNAFDSLYKKYTQFDGELNHLYEEGKELFGDTFCKGKWEARLKFTQLKEKEAEALIPAPAAPISDWWLKEREILKSTLPKDLAGLIADIRKLKKKFSSKIDNHPVKRIEVLKKELAQLDQKILKDSTIRALKTWVANNPKEAKRAFVEVREHVPQSEEIAEWLKLKEHKDLIRNSVKKICHRNDLMRRKLRGAQNHCPSKYSLPSGVTDYIDDKMKPLRKIVGNSGESSRLKVFWGELVHKHLVHPFEPVQDPQEPKISPLVRNRRVVELSVNRQLKKIDDEMVITNRVRAYGLEWAAYSVMLAVQAIFRFNPWVAWGVAGTTLLIRGASHYLKLQLHKSEGKKQGLKFQMLLNDYVQISGIPGTYPALRYLKRLQDEYCLDGVTRTWARILGEGEKNVFSAPILRILLDDHKKDLPGSLQTDEDKKRNIELKKCNIELLRENIEKIKSKGVVESTKILGNMLTYAKSMKTALSKQEFKTEACRDKIKTLGKNIKFLEKAKKPRNKKKKRRINFFEELSSEKRTKKKVYEKLVVKRGKAIRQRQRVEKELEYIAHKNRLFEEKKTLIAKVTSEDEAKNSREYQILIHERGLLEKALEGEHPRTGVVSDIQRLVTDIRMSGQGEPEKLTKELEEKLKILRNCPRDALLLELKEKSLELNKLQKSNHAHQMRKIYLTLSKEKEVAIDDRVLREEKKEAEALIAEKTTAINEAVQTQRALWEELQTKSPLKDIVHVYRPSAEEVIKDQKIIEAAELSNRSKVELDRLLDDRLWEENLDTIRELYNELNAYHRSTVWWRLPGVLRNEIREAEKKSRINKKHLESILAAGSWERDEKTIRYFFGELNPEHQKVMLKKLCKLFGEELVKKSLEG